MSKRWILLLSVTLPLAAFIGILGWGVARSGGNPGGFLVNFKLGEIKVEAKQAPDFTLPTYDGRSLTLSQMRGKVVMVDFWSSWCPPCRAESPTLEQVYREYRGRSVEFVGVAIWDSKGAIQDFIRKFRLTYPIVLDDRGVVGIDFAVRGLPEKFFLDKEGRIVRKFIGPMDEVTLRGVLNQLLK